MVTAIAVTTNTVVAVSAESIDSASQAIATQDRKAPTSSRRAAETPVAVRRRIASTTTVGDSSA